mmetsp:Transcript_80806/g.224867  ORF Transcript_80806/g.224867 Transcript_80806/m.224867 type:complete len:232 (-) Transcript_80806:154-849(-)
MAPRLQKSARGQEPPRTADACAPFAARCHHGGVKFLRLHDQRPELWQRTPAEQLDRENDLGEFAVAADVKKRNCATRCLGEIPKAVGFFEDIEELKRDVREAAPSLCEVLVADVKADHRASARVQDRGAKTHATPHFDHGVLSGDEDACEVAIVPCVCCDDDARRSARRARDFTTRLHVGTECQRAGLGVVRAIVVVVARFHASVSCGTVRGGIPSHCAMRESEPVGAEVV